MNNPQYITDNKGKKLSVVLPMKEYKKMMEELEELEDIRLYDEAMANNQPSIPIEGANASFDKKSLKRIEDIEKLDEETKKYIYFFIDNAIQNIKAKKAFAS